MKPYGQCNSCELTEEELVNFLTTVPICTEAVKEKRHKILTHVLRAALQTLIKRLLAIELLKTAASFLNVEMIIGTTIEALKFSRHFIQEMIRSTTTNILKQLNISAVQRSADWP